MTTRMSIALAASFFIATFSLAAQQLPPKPAPDGLTVNRTWTDADLDKIMKQVGPTAANLGKMIDAQNGPSSESHADTLEHLFRDVDDFFGNRKMEDAEEIAQTATARANDIEEAVKDKDFTKASEHLNALMGVCQTCHSKFRDRDASGAYHLKKQ
jgi:cytochrome c556